VCCLQWSQLPLVKTTALPIDWLPWWDSCMDGSMVNLCVSLTTGLWCTQIFVQTLSWLHLCGCLSMRLAFKSMDWIKQMALPTVVGLEQPVENLNRTKRLILSQIRISFLPNCFWMYTMEFSPPLGLNWDISFLWAPSPRSHPADLGCF
jgi:hypothetical protein